MVGTELLVILIGYLIVVLIMGCFLNSVSIMLILLPFVLPVMNSFGVDFMIRVITVIAIEVGLLTPPTQASRFLWSRQIWDRPEHNDLAGIQGCGADDADDVRRARRLRPVFPSLSLVLIGQKWNWWWPASPI